MISNEYENGPAEIGCDWIVAGFGQLFLGVRELSWADDGTLEFDPLLRWICCLWKAGAGGVFLVHESFHGSCGLSFQDVLDGPSWFQLLLLLPEFQLLEAGCWTGCAFQLVFHWFEFLFQSEFQAVSWLVPCHDDPFPGIFLAGASGVAGTGGGGAATSC